MNKLDKFLNEGNPAYCGIKIVNNKELLSLVADLDETWEKLAHHVTIKMGGLPEELKKSKGKEVIVTAVKLGLLDNKVVAVEVVLDGIKTNNSIAHVTLAVNRKNGGKPVMSNQITKWEPLAKEIILKGIISEFSSNGETI